MTSFHGKQEIKDYYIARVKAHAAADEIIQGSYWENGKGCAVGCTVHSDSHAAYEQELGISRIIARLQDRIFEGLSNEDAKEFPLQFLEAAPVGKDLNPVWRKFLHWLLVDPEYGVIRFAKSEQTKTAIIEVAGAIYLSLTEDVPKEKWQEVRNLADAADAADAAAYAAADAAYAADAAAYAAAYAADAAAYAADAAAAAYAAAAAAYAYAAYARRAYYQAMSDKLLSLLKAA